MHKSTALRRRSLALLAVGPLTVAGLTVGSTVQASAAPSENSSCVAKFNVAVGTPGEFQRENHQEKLGRDVSSFARLGEECPFSVAETPRRSQMNSGADSDKRHNPPG
jgi:hypothetical protein